MQIEEILAIFIQSLLHGYDKAIKALKNISQKSLEGAKKLFWIGLIGYIASIIVAKIGQEMDSRSIITWGFIGKAFFSLIICGMGAAIASTIESVVTWKKSGSAYFYAVKFFFVINLFFALLVSFSGLVSAGPIIPEMITLPILAIFIIAVTKHLDGQMAGIKFLTYLMLAVVIFMYFSPHSLGRLFQKIKGLDETGGQAKLVAICPGDAKNRRIIFYQSGRVHKWYFRLPDGSFEFFDGPGSHDFYKGNLVEIDDKVIAVIENDESKISKRNLDLCESGPQNKKIAEIKIAESGTGNDPNTAKIAKVEPPQTQAEAPRYDGPDLVSTPSVVDLRTEYAVIVIDGNNTRDWQLTSDIVTWLGAEKAANGNDHLTNFVMNGGDLSAVSRSQLSKVAKKILLIAYKSRFDRAEGSYRLWTASYGAKIIDADTGQIIKALPLKSFPVKELDDRHAEETALEFARRSMKVQCENYL